MKRSIVLLVLLSIGISACAQISESDSHYVVIGTFSTAENASHFTSKVNRSGFNAQYAINPATHLYYVFLMETSDITRAKNSALKIKTETEFKSVWVFNGKLGFSTGTFSLEELQAVSVNPPKIQFPENKSSLANLSSVKPIFFKVISNADGREIICSLLLKESGSTSCRWINSGEVVKVQQPQVEGNVYKVSAIIPGYKERSITFFYDNPSVEKGFDNTDVITLSLDKARSDDYVDFNNVHFTVNSAFLRPVSKNELDELVTLLNKDQRTNIIIHGHCDGRPENMDALGAEEIKKETLASEALAHSRADAVKSYLMLHGIDGSRIHTKGERMPLPHDAVEGKYKNAIEVEFVMAM
ncbi:MAG TPA: hypothetical protein DGG95_08485 [Cytophagales bacterium]|nr:hypothetical protein [Cytophagales bacterium]